MDRIIPDSGGVATTAAPESATRRPVGAFVSGSIKFYGKVRRIEGASLEVSMPDGHFLTLDVIAGQTDLSHNDHDMPVVGQMIKARATARPDGSFTAAEIARVRHGERREQSEVKYRGVTTSQVGPDMTLHFQVGMMVFSYPISATADLSDFGGSAQAIGASEYIEAEITFQQTRGTVVEVEREQAV